MVTIVENGWDIINRNRKRECTLGYHVVGCGCGQYVDTQCCDAVRAYNCRLHKCGPRVGCRCPLPETRDSSGQTPTVTAEVLEVAAG